MDGCCDKSSGKYFGGILVAYLLYSFSARVCMLLRVGGNKIHEGTWLVRFSLSLHCTDQHSIAWPTRRFQIEVGWTLPKVVEVRGIERKRSPRLASI